MNGRPTRVGLLGPTPPGVAGPIPRPVATKIVHLGIGAFARAHPIAYTETATERAGDARWGVLGVTGRTPVVAESLAGQEELYGILERSRSGASARWIGSLTGVAAARETERVVATIAHADTAVITLTITEKAYASSGMPIRLLAAGLRRRHELGGMPLTVLSCDNLVANGQVLRRVLHDAAADGGSSASFDHWFDNEVTTPSSMVDRMTPETTEADRRDASALTGYHDAALVVAESFSEWIIQDRFAAERPEWELAGAVLVKDVAAHEAVKLRLLNGTHTLLACAGALLGLDTIAEAVSSPLLRPWCVAWQDDARRSLEGRADIDLEAYAASVLDRCANPFLRHATRQVARDTSKKLWMRVLLAASEETVRGRLPAGAAFAIGSWVAFVIHETVHGRTLDDPCATELAQAVQSAGADPARAVIPLLRIASVGSTAAPWDQEFLREITDRARDLLRLAGGPSR